MGSQKRDVQRGSARRSPFKGRERAIENETNTGSVSNQLWRNFQVECIIMDVSERIDTIMN